MATWIRFDERKPQYKGDYWYWSGNERDRPRIRQFDADRGKFVGDPDQFGYHTLIDPKYWAHVEYPTLDKDNL